MDLEKKPKNKKACKGISGKECSSKVKSSLWGLGQLLLVSWIQFLEWSMSHSNLVIFFPLVSPSVSRLNPCHPSRRMRCSNEYRDVKYSQRLGQKALGVENSGISKAASQKTFIITWFIAHKALNTSQRNKWLLMYTHRPWYSIIA